MTSLSKPTGRRGLLLWLLVYLCSFSRELNVRAEPDGGDKGAIGSLDAELVNALIASAESKHGQPLSPEIREAALGGQANALFQVAKAGSDKVSAVKLYHQLASHQHVGSQVQLGMYYYGQGDTTTALKFFVEAGENGPHQASLYNAGKIYAETKQWVPALAYVRACATFQSEGETPSKTTETCVEAFDMIAKKVSEIDSLSVEETADIFMYGSLDESFPGETEAQYWVNAIMALQKFNQTFVATSGQSQDREQLEIVKSNLHQLWGTSATKCSKLQAYLLLEHMNDALGPLAGYDDKYLSLAAAYAEALARSPYCFDHAANDEADAACFNGAVASAMSYYRRTKDPQLENVKRLWKFATEEHPTAATKWQRMEQTPRVYHEGLEAKPWWNFSQFEIVRAMEELYKKDKSKILKEVQAVKDLQEGKYLLDQQKEQEMEIDANGNLQKATRDKSSDVGLQRIFTPYIGVRTADEKTRTSGAGGWSSYGPLFDGRQWYEDKCSVIPTLCEIVRKHHSSLCTSNRIGHASDNAVQTKEDVARRCGADIVVTGLRLRPGTHILPHCGTTNRRLILHWCLEGCDGIKFYVGNEPPLRSYGGGDGSAVVFDDSFEHAVKHDGDKARFVLLVVLAHPDSI